MEVEELGMLAMVDEATWDAGGEPPCDEGAALPAIEVALDGKVVVPLTDLLGLPGIDGVR